MPEGQFTRRVVFTQAGWDDYRFWRASDPVIFEDLTEVISSIACGHEAVDNSTRLLSGQQAAWSRRINGKHRLVYVLDGDDLVILQARYR